MLKQASSLFVFLNLKIIERVSIDELGTIEIVKAELAKMQKLLSLVSKIDADPKTIENLKKIDVHACAKFILEDGSKEERRNLLGQLKSQIILKDKKLAIEQTKKKCQSSKMGQSLV
ncbi:MAG: hypothetical protein WC477_05725 [Patescibacteria group bacterium]